MAALLIMPLLAAPAPPPPTEVIPLEEELVVGSPGGSSEPQARNAEPAKRRLRMVSWTDAGQRIMRASIARQTGTGVQIAFPRIGSQLS
jgi:hypothetical protein